MRRRGRDKDEKGRRRGRSRREIREREEGRKQGERIQNCIGLSLYGSRERAFASELADIRGTLDFSTVC